MLESAPLFHHTESIFAAHTAWHIYHVELYVYEDGIHKRCPLLPVRNIDVTLCYHQNGDILIEYWNILACRCRAIFDQMDSSS